MQISGMPPASEIKKKRKTNGEQGEEGQNRGKGSAGHGALS